MEVIRKAEKAAIAILESVKPKLGSKKYEHLKLQFTGTENMLAKGELLLTALDDIEHGGTAQYPVGILQPIINTIEICANTYALLADNAFLDYKTSDFRELGKVIGYIADKRLQSEQSRLVYALKAANEIRRESAHPNKTEPFNVIIGEKRRVIYEALTVLVKEIEKIL